MEEGYSSRIRNGMGVAQVQMRPRRSDTSRSSVRTPPLLPHFSTSISSTNTPSTAAHLSPDEQEEYGALCLAYRDLGLDDPPLPPQHFTFRVIRQYKGDLGYFHVWEDAYKMDAYKLYALFAFRSPTLLTQISRY